MNDHILQSLLATWKPRLHLYDKDFSLYAQGYRDALSECLHDLNDASTKDAVDYLDSLEADSLLSTIEEHDAAYA